MVLASVKLLALVYLRKLSILPKSDARAQARTIHEPRRLSRRICEAPLFSLDGQLAVADTNRDQDGALVDELFW